MFRLLIFFLFVNFLGFSQNVYKVDYGVEYLGFSVDTTGVDEFTKEFLIENENESKRFLKDDITLFELYFDQQMSIFVSVDMLEIDDQNKPISLLSKISEYAYLLKKRKLYSKNDSYFVDIKPHTQNWEIMDETKKILGYKCRKAIINNYSKAKPKIIAWFTEEIPVSYGPINFYGLPGLILELDRYDRLIYATVIEPVQFEDVKAVLKKKDLRVKK